MDQALRNTAIAAMYEDAHARLCDTLTALNDAVAAASNGQMNLARGTALEVEQALDAATKLMACASALHALRP